MTNFTKKYQCTNLYSLLNAWNIYHSNGKMDVKNIDLTKIK